MRWWILLLLLPAPVLADGWYYQGDTWEDDGILYGVDGNDPDLLFLSIGQNRLLISLYDCKELDGVEYCYTETAYPSDDEHIKYEAGEELYGFYITLDDLGGVEVNVDREVEDDNIEFGEETEVEIIVANDGSVSITDIEYRIPIPSGLDIAYGPKEGNTIVFEQAALPVGAQTKFRYTLSAEQFGEYNIVPNMSYKHNGAIVYADVDDWTLEVDSPLTIERLVTTELAIDEEGEYWLNVTNDEDSVLDITVTITIPEEVAVLEFEGFAWEEDKLVYTFDLKEDETEELFFTFSTSGKGTIETNVSFENDGFTASEVFSDDPSAAQDLVEPELRLIPDLARYNSGTELNVTAVVENLNGDVRFEDVSGFLESELWGKLLFRHPSIGPLEEVTEVQKTVILPNVETSTSYAITFEGSYFTPKGTEYTFSETKTITVSPFARSIEVTHSVDPPNPDRGQNISVTVTGKNVGDEYLTIDAHERYPAGFIKTGGLTFVETSLEREASEKLYQYDLEIPADYKEDSFIITTVVLIDQEGVTEETSMEIILPELPPEPEAGGNETTNASAPLVLAETEEVSGEEAAAEEKGKLGFFSSIWDFIKGLFS